MKTAGGDGGSTVGRGKEGEIYEVIHVQTAFSQSSMDDETDSLLSVATCEILRFFF